MVPANQRMQRAAAAQFIVRDGWRLAASPDVNNWLKGRP